MAHHDCPAGCRSSDKSQSLDTHTSDRKHILSLAQGWLLHKAVRAMGQAQDAPSDGSCFLQSYASGRLLHSRTHCRLTVWQSPLQSHIVSGKPSSTHWLPVSHASTWYQMLSSLDKSMTWTIQTLLHLTENQPWLSLRFSHDLH